MQHAVVTLIRHAETTGNLGRLLQGITDSPLTVYGQAQVDALAQAWKTTTAVGDAKTLKLPPPTLIVCSPVGRARKTAEAIHAACTPLPPSSAIVLEPSSPRFASSPKRQDVLQSAPPSLVVDFGLAEKDFGARESTRNGVHVAGFPKGTGLGESKADFALKVHTVGQEWVRAAAAGSTAQTPPHVVLVTHGMWIATFFSATPSASPAPPFAANTGIFSLKVSLNEADKVASELFKVNDTRHLDHVKRQKGGFGRVAFDPAQTKLSSFFAQPRDPESPSKKRKM